MGFSHYHRRPLYILFIFCANGFRLRLSRSVIYLGDAPSSPKLFGLRCWCLMFHISRIAAPSMKSGDLWMIRFITLTLSTTLVGSSSRNLTHLRSSFRISRKSLFFYPFPENLRSRRSGSMEYVPSFIWSAKYWNACALMLKYTPLNLSSTP